MDINEKYTIIKKIDEGAFGNVLLATSKEDGSRVAIKQIKEKVRSWNDCLNMREVKSLRKMKHKNIIKLREARKHKDTLYLIFDFAETNLFKLYMDYKKKVCTLFLSKFQFQPFPVPLIRKMILETLDALHFTHRSGYFHRDMKPENLLVTEDMVLKLADYGLAREIRSMPPFTDYISTRWYRAPELLLRAQAYGPAVDIFALGCIMVQIFSFNFQAELYLLKPLFAGENEVDQLHKIMKVLGKPPVVWKKGYQLAKSLGINFPEQPKIPLKDIITNASDSAIDLMERMLQYDPLNRPSAKELLNHKYFSEGPKDMVASMGIAQNPKTYEKMRYNKSDMLSKMDSIKSINNMDLSNSRLSQLNKEEIQSIRSKKNRLDSSEIMKEIKTKRKDIHQHDLDEDFEPWKNQPTFRLKDYNQPYERNKPANMNIGENDRTNRRKQPHLKQKIKKTWDLEQNFSGLDMSFEENHKQKEKSRVDLELDSFIHDISGVTKKNLATLDNTINHVTKNILNHPSEFKNSKKAVLGSEFDSLIERDDSLFKRNNQPPKRKESHSNWMEKQSTLGKKSKNITNIQEKKPRLNDFDFEFDDILKKEEPSGTKKARKMGREGSRVLGSNRYIADENSYKSRRNKPIAKTKPKKKTPTKADAWDQLESELNDFM